MSSSDIQAAMAASRETFRLEGELHRQMVTALVLSEREADRKAQAEREAKADSEAKAQAEREAKAQACRDWKAQRAAFLQREYELAREARHAESLALHREFLRDLSPDELASFLERQRAARERIKVEQESLKSWLDAPATRKLLDTIRRMPAKAYIQSFAPDDYECKHG